MHYQHLSHETQRIAHTSWEWHTLPDTTSLNRMAKMVNSVTILLGSKNLDYPMPGWHGSHKFRPQNRKGESWSSNATTISLEPNENATHSAAKGHKGWQANSQQQRNLPCAQPNPPALTLLHCTQLASRSNPNSYQTKWIFTSIYM